MTTEKCLQFNQILLVMMLPVIGTQATVVQKRFKKLDPEQNIKGAIGAELKTESLEECAVRQVSTNYCKG